MLRGIPCRLYDLKLPLANAKDFLLALQFFCGSPYLLIAFRELPLKFQKARPKELELNTFRIQYPL